MSTRIRDIAKSKRSMQRYITPEDIQDVINDMIGSPEGNLDKQDHYDLLREVVKIAADGWGMEDQGLCFFVADRAEYQDYSDLED